MSCSTSCPLRPGPDSEVRGFDQASQVTCAQVRGLAGFNCCPQQLGSGSEGPRVDQLSRATRARFRGPAASTSYPGRLGPLPEDPRSRPAVPCDLGASPRVHSVDQLSRVIWAWVRGLAVFTCCHRRLWPGSTGPRCGPVSLVTHARVRGPWGRLAVPVDSRSCVRARGVDQLSRAIRDRVGLPTGSTSCPR